MGQKAKKEPPDSAFFFFFSFPSVPAFLSIHAFLIIIKTIPHSSLLPALWGREWWRVMLRVLGWYDYKRLGLLSRHANPGAESLLLARPGCLCVGARDKDRGRGNRPEVARNTPKTSSSWTVVSHSAQTHFLVKAPNTIAALEVMYGG